MVVSEHSLVGSALNVSSKKCYGVCFCLSVCIVSCCRVKQDKTLGFRLVWKSKSVCFFLPQT